MSSRFGSIRPATGFVALCAVLCLAAPASGAVGTAAKQAYIVDQRTGTVLLEKNAHAPAPLASLSKLMTLYMVFERLWKTVADAAVLTEAEARALPGPCRPYLTTVGTRTRPERSCSKPSPRNSSPSMASDGNRRPWR